MVAACELTFLNVGTWGEGGGEEERGRKYVWAHLASSGNSRL